MAAQGMVAHSAVQQEPVLAAMTMEKGISASSEPRADPPLPYKAAALALVARHYTDKVDV